MKKVILDCDPGNGIPGSDVDDGLAFGFLAAHPDVELLGITVVSGNTSTADGYRVARTMVSVEGREVPVIAGAVRAMSEDPQKWIQRRARAEAPAGAFSVWDGVEGPGDYLAPVDDDAAGFIIRIAAQHPGEVHLVAIGPLTNIAMALMRRPELASELASIHIMGGSFNAPGFLQELNFAVDPEAANMVLGCGAAIRLFPLDVTLLTNLTLSDLEQWETETPIGKYLVDTTRPWIEFQSAFRHRNGCALHDPLAAVALLDPEVVTFKEQVVSVECAGSLTRSRPIGWDVSGPRMAAGLDLPVQPSIEVAVTVDNERLVAALSASFS